MFERGDEQTKQQTEDQQGQQGQQGQETNVQQGQQGQQGQQQQQQQGQQQADFFEAKFEEEQAKVEEEQGRVEELEAQVSELQAEKVAEHKKGLLRGLSIQGHLQQAESQQAATTESQPEKADVHQSTKSQQSKSYLSKATAGAEGLLSGMKSGVKSLFGSKTGDLERTQQKEQTQQTKLATVQQTQQTKLATVQQQQSLPPNRAAPGTEGQAVKDATYKSVSSANGNPTFGAGPYNFMPTTSNIHLRTEENGAPADAVRGLEYLGAGYDIIFGNPLGTMKGELDPGFRDPVIEHQFNYYNSWQEAQNQPCGPIGLDMECPAGIRVRREFNCNHQSKSTEISSSQDMQKSLDTQASQETEVEFEASGGGMGVTASAGFGARFSGSEAFSSASQSMENEDKEFFETTTLCTEFYLTYKKAHKPVYDAGFAAAVKALEQFVPCNKSFALSACDKKGYVDYMSLFETYGTDVVQSVEMGAKRIHRMEFSAKDVTKMKSEGTDVSKETAISANIGGGGYGVEMSASASHEAKSAQQAKEAATDAVKNSASNEYDINVGGLPTEDWREWASGVAERPMPVRYSFRTLQDQVTLWPVEGAKEDIGKWMAEAYDAYGLRFGQNYDPAEVEADPNVFVGPDGKVVPTGVYGIVLKSGNRMSDTNGGNYVSQSGGQAKKIQYGGDGFKQMGVPITVASMVVSSCGSFALTPATEFSVAVKEETIEGFSVVAGVGSRGSPGSYPISFITGLTNAKWPETQADAEATKVVFGGASSDGAPLWSGAANYAYTVTPPMSMVTLTFPYLKDAKHPPAVVVTPAGTPAGGVTAWPVICSQVHTEGGWQVKVAGHGEYGLNFLATNSDKDVMSWAVVNADHASVASHAGMKVVTATTDADKEFIKKTTAWDWQSVAKKATAQEKLKTTQGYVELEFTVQYESAPSCVVTQLFPSQESDSADKICTGAKCHGHGHSVDTNNDVDDALTTTTWTKTHGASCDDEITLTKKTLQECKDEAFAKRDSHGIEGFSRYMPGSGGADDSEQKCWLCKGGFEKAGDDGNEDLYTMADVKPEHCGVEYSSAVITGITSRKVAVETGNRHGVPTNRAFNIVCTGKIVV